MAPCGLVRSRGGFDVATNKVLATLGCLAASAAIHSRQLARLQREHNAAQLHDLSATHLRRPERQYIAALL